MRRWNGRLDGSPHSYGTVANGVRSKACGMTFCRLRVVSTAMEPPMLGSHHQERLNSYIAQKDIVHQRPVPQQRVRKCKRDDGIDDEILNFRRVRIQSSTRSKTRCVLYELKINGRNGLGIGSCHGRYVDVSIVLICTVVYVQAFPSATIT
jgi:hypothetical protein